MRHWLVKSEPTKYSWDTFLKEKGTFWDGVRNYQARNNLQLMKKGDLVLFYHSNEGKEVVGIAMVSRENYQDPTTTDQKWVVVDLIPVESLKKPISLETIKKDSKLQNIGLVKQGRLSVVSIEMDEFNRILELSIGPKTNGMM